MQACCYCFSGWGQFNNTWSIITSYIYLLRYYSIYFHGFPYENSNDCCTLMFQNDVVLVSRYSDPVTQVPKGCPVGTVICLRHPRKHNHLLIKRLVGLEGNFYGREIPPGFCWVASDAGTGFRDSSLFGPVPLTDVLGDVKLIIFPFHRFGRLPVKIFLNSVRFGNFLVIWLLF